MKTKINIKIVLFYLHKYMGNSSYKSASVDIPEGSPLMEDVIRAERLEKMLNPNNSKPIYGSLCCKERERGNYFERQEKIRIVLERHNHNKGCCKCLYGRCVCKSRARSYSYSDV